jgi:hypothetical protein
MGRRKQIKLSKDGPFNSANAIVVDRVEFDIGCRVVKWNEPSGFNGYTKKKVVKHIVDRKTGREKTKVIKGPRYKERKKGLEGITQFFVHHSGGDGQTPRNMYETLYNTRGLSVTYANEDNGVVYQFNDVNVATFHAGKHNQPSIGVENCLFPIVKDRPDYYSKKRNALNGNLPHDIRTERVHGVKIQTFCFPEKQIDSLARLTAGNWVALAFLTGEPQFLEYPELPRSRGKVIKSAIKDPLKHVGTIAHFHATRRKIDPLGLDWELNTMTNS